MSSRQTAADLVVVVIMIVFVDLVSQCHVYNHRQARVRTSINLELLPATAIVTTTVRARRNRSQIQRLKIASHSAMRPIKALDIDYYDFPT